MCTNLSYSSIALSEVLLETPKQNTGICVRIVQCWEKKPGLEELANRCQAIAFTERLQNLDEVDDRPTRLAACSDEALETNPPRRPAKGVEARRPRRASPSSRAIPRPK